MRALTALATGAFLIAATGSPIAGPFPPGGLAVGDHGGASIQLVAAKKGDTVTQKVKRAWKNLVGYKFDVACPFAARTTCSETGDSKDAARGKCISRHTFCWVSDAN